VVEERVTGDFDHLLIATTLPWLLPTDCTTWKRGTKRLLKDFRLGSGRADLSV
jgi:hypothetical protein